METLSKRKLEKMKKHIEELRFPETQKWHLQENCQILDEGYHNFGDYILVFPNPDNGDGYEYAQNTLSFGHAMMDFEKAFSVDCAFETINEDEELYRQAFFNCFSGLQVPKSTKLEHMERDKIDSSKAKYFMHDINGDKVRINPDDERQMGGGGFLIYNRSKCYWERRVIRSEIIGGQSRLAPVNDVSSLFREYCILKLVKYGGFFVRQFLSEDQNSIYVVLYAELKNLKIEAERIGLKKKIDIAYCDILSLEPVDERYRPLRLNKLLTTTQYKEGADLDEIKNEIVYLLKQVDYSRMAKECGQTPFDFQGEILDQYDVPFKTWQIYMIYLRLLSKGLTKIRHKYKNKLVTMEDDEKREILNSFAKQTTFKDKSTKPYVVDQHIALCNNQINDRQLKAFYAHRQSKEIKDLILKTNAKIKQLYGNKLQTFWDKFLTQPEGPYVDYFEPHKDKCSNAILKVRNLWTNQIINKKKDTTLFNKMERGKLVTSILSQLVNLDYMVSMKHLESYFIPNSYFDLNGEKLNSLTKALEKKLDKEPGLIFSAVVQQARKNEALKSMTLRQSKTKAPDQTPKANTGQPVQKKKKKPSSSRDPEKLRKVKGGLTGGTNLAQKWTLFNVPYQQLGDYYGERIALYFMFITYFIQELIAIAFFGIVTFLVQFLYTPEQTPNQLSLIFFTFLIVFWSSTFQSMWKRKEIEFQTMFGLEDLEYRQIELVGYIGKASRSIATDKINEIYFSPAVTWARIFVGLLLVLIFIVIEIVIICWLQVLIIWFEEQQNLPYVPYIAMEVFIPALIWVIIGMILDALFRPLAQFLTTWENHKYLSEFETSFTIKILIFSTVNRLGMPFIIAFINYFTFKCTNDNDCWGQLEIYMRVAFILEFFKHLFFNFLFPVIKYAGKRVAQQVTSLADYTYDRYKNTPFVKINERLQLESRKEDFSENNIDGTIYEYLELCLQYALLANYGSPFPIVFVMSFGMNCFELMVDKYKMLLITKKPIPQSARSIGTFVQYMDLISYVAIFNNSAVMAFTNTNIFQSIPSFSLFIIMLIGFFIFKFITDMIYGNNNGTVEQIRQRHKQIEKRINLGQRTKSSVPTEPSFPIMKIYGTKLDQ